MTVTRERVLALKLPESLGGHIGVTMYVHGGGELQSYSVVVTVDADFPRDYRHKLRADAYDNFASIVEVFLQECEHGYCLIGEVFYHQDWLSYVDFIRADKSLHTLKWRKFIAEMLGRGLDFVVSENDNVGSW